MVTSWLLDSKIGLQLPTCQHYTSLPYQFLHPAILSAVSARCLKVERCEKCTHCATCRSLNTKSPLAGWCVFLHVTSKKTIQNSIYYISIYQSQMMPNDARCASCTVFLDQNNSKRLDKSWRFHQLGLARESQRTPPRASSGVSVSTAICRTKRVQHKHNSDPATQYTEAN